MIGTQVGAYEVIKKLGEGGMGAVYLAKHKLMGKEAAVKVLLPQFCAVPAIVERFFNEAKAAAAIKHPGVVDVYDFGTQADGSAYIVMELLDGEELSDLLGREGAQPADKVRLIGQQIAATLEAVHASGIVHRDLKPDNIYLEPDPAAVGGMRAKVLDFGIAKLSEDLKGSSSKTQTGAVMGTPVFMSPEQCTGEGKVDLRADIYSLGCILFMMLAGRPPFIKNGAGALIAAHITEIPVGVDTLVPGVDPDLRDIIREMLAKDPAERPQTMGEVAKRLAGDEVTAPVRARTAPTEEAGSSQAMAKTEVAGSATTLGGAAAAVSNSAITEPPSSGKGKLVAAGVVLAGAAAAAVLVLGGGGDKSSQAAEPSAAAPAPAANTAEEEATPTEVAPKTHIKLALNSEPTGAKVYNAKTGIELGVTPLTREFRRQDAEIELLLRAEGYEDERMTLSLTEDQELNRSLAAVPSAEPASAEPAKEEKVSKKSSRRKDRKKDKKASEPEKTTTAPKDPPKKEEPKKSGWGELAD